MSALRALVLCALAGASSAKEAPELLREESFNYRIVGKLPVGWSRDKAGVLSYTFAAEEIPHGHIRIVRERVKGKLDARKLMDRPKVLSNLQYLGMMFQNNCKHK